MKKVILGAIVLFFVLPVLHVRAAVLITEIMYDPPGSSTEWIEVYNNGTQAVDLTKYYLYTAGPSSTRHGITQKGQFSNMLAPSSYAIIADDQADFISNYPNLVSFDSSFSISTTNSSVLIITSDSTKPPQSYDDQEICDPSLGAKNDGNSLQINSAGVWMSSSPTPDADNTFTALANENNQTSTSTNQTQNTNATSTTSSGGIEALGDPAPSIQNNSNDYPTLSFSVPKTVIANVSFNVYPLAINLDNSPVNAKTFHFSMGDGGFHDDYSPNQFSYTYDYPGSYVISMSYNPNPYSNNPQNIVIVRKIINVVKPNISLGSIYDDGSIEISNNDNNEVDISGWQIEDAKQNTNFVIPNGTIILAGATLRLGQKITNIDFGKNEEGYLYLPDGQIYQNDNLSKTQIPSVVSKNLNQNSVPPVSLVSYNSVSKKSIINKKNPVKNSSSVLTQADVQNIATSTPQVIDLSANALQGIDPSNNFSFKNSEFVVIAVAGLGMIAGIYFAIKKSNIKFSDILSNKKKNLDDDIRIIDD